VSNVTYTYQWKWNIRTLTRERIVQIESAIPKSRYGIVRALSEEYIRHTRALASANNLIIRNNEIIIYKQYPYKEHKILFSLEYYARIEKSATIFMYREKRPSQATSHSFHRVTMKISRWWKSDAWMISLSHKKKNCSIYSYSSTNNFLEHKCNVIISVALIVMRI